MDLKHRGEIWAVNIDLKHPVDIIKAIGGGEIISREGIGKISHQTMEPYGIQVSRSTESRRNSHEKDKGVIIGEGRKP